VRAAETGKRRDVEAAHLGDRCKRVAAKLAVSNDAKRGRRPENRPAQMERALRVEEAACCLTRSPR
jgi:hypothetical protein